MVRIATSKTRENYPIDKPKKIEIDLHFSTKQFAKLKTGIVPRQMEDKWFIYYEKNWLFFHRSWTGFGIYKANLQKVEDGYSIKEFWAERNKEKYNNEDDDTDIETFSFLIARGLLGIDVRELYFTRNMKADPDYITGWSNFGQMLYSNQGTDYSYEVKSALFGVAIGDSLGVPVEFKSRKAISMKPVTGMTEYGTYNLPAGTWSDDSSLTFCLAEALTHGYDLNAIAQNFVKWYYKDFWTARGNVFDIGIATKKAIERLANGERPELTGEVDEKSNGNGSLMRILPLLFYLHDKTIAERYELIRQVSSITHAHIRSVIACFYYLEFARHVFEGMDKFDIYENLKTEIPEHLASVQVSTSEITRFSRLLDQDIYEFSAEEIKSDAYVLNTLEAAIWCLMTTENFRDAVLKAVNLGEDTDTTGAVTGGLGGLLYGIDGIPQEWMDQVARKDDIEKLAETLGAKISE
jgi:ADP-ribosylglycohydrolase